MVAFIELKNMSRNTFLVEEGEGKNMSFIFSMLCLRCVSVIQAERSNRQLGMKDKESLACSYLKPWN